MINTGTFAIDANKNSFIIWLLASLLIIGLYNFITFNRYFPITEGWFSVYASLILQGKIPYKDFYLFLPPLYPLTLASFISIFGPAFIGLRILGIAVILGMTSALYFILNRFFESGVAALVTVCCIIYYQSGVAHISYDFIQFFTTYELISICFLIKHYDQLFHSRTSHSTVHYAYIVIAGLFGALAFLTKQSNGLFVNAFIFLAMLLSIYSLDQKYVIKTVLSYIIGFSCPIFLIVGWLIYHDALNAAYQQIFVGAVKTKGTLTHIFFNWIIELFKEQYFKQLLGLSCILFTLGYWRLLIGKHHFSAKNTIRNNLLYLSIFFSLALLLILPFYPALAFDKFKFCEWCTQQVLANIIVISTAIPILFFVHQFLKITLFKIPTPEIILSTAALGFIYGCGASAGITELGAFLGFALFLCCLFSIKNFFNLGKAIGLGLILCFTSYLISQKYSHPYAWWSITTPTIKESTHHSHLPLLRGLYLPAETIDKLTMIDSIVQNNTHSKDAILTFPNIPVFYLLEQRFANIKAVVHWPDFLPDNFAYKEADRILQNPPKVIIYLDLPELVWSEHERLFRSGKPSGQRAILASIHALISNNALYTLKASMPINNEVQLKVWLRNNTDNSGIL